MTRKEALAKLIAAVEAGAFDGVPVKYNAFARAWEAAFGSYYEPNFTGPLSAYSGSLDAAKALHKAVLPECAYVISHRASEIYVFVQKGERKKWHEGVDRCPARAWLLAILRALHTQKQS